MVTREQFQAYLAVRDSGVTNMFDTKAVIKYAKKFSGVVLERKDCLEIMANFMKLKYEYLEKK
jgi:hypothetical protein